MRVFGGLIAPASLSFVPLVSPEQCPTVSRKQTSLLEQGILLNKFVSKFSQTVYHEACDLAQHFRQRINTLDCGQHQAENTQLTKAISTPDREVSTPRRDSALHRKKSTQASVVEVSSMCLLVITHQTKCETRRPVVVNVESDYTIFHPYERPPPCRHQEIKSEQPRCPSHGACCTYLRWRICCATGENPKCDRWEILHMVISGYHERTMLSGLAKQQHLSIKSMISSRAPDCYRKLRLKFFDTGAAVAHWAHAANKLGNLIYDDSVSEDSKDIARDRFEMVFEEWQRNVESLDKLTSLWDSNAGIGTMETRIAPIRLALSGCTYDRFSAYSYAYRVASSL